jgi:hypothetical protein
MYTNLGRQVQVSAAIYATNGRNIFTVCINTLKINMRIHTYIYTYLGRQVQVSAAIYATNGRNIFTVCINTLKINMRIHTYIHIYKPWKASSSLHCNLRYRLTHKPPAAQRTICQVPSSQRQDAARKRQSWYPLVCGERVP